MELLEGRNGRTVARLRGDEIPSPAGMASYHPGSLAT